VQRLSSENSGRAITDQFTRALLVAVSRSRGPTAGAFPCIIAAPPELLSGEREVNRLWRREKGVCVFMVATLPCNWFAPAVAIGVAVEANETREDAWV